MDAMRVIEDAFRQSGLAGIDVCADADVSDAFLFADHISASPGELSR
jgi:hypothetical protein